MSNATVLIVEDELAIAELLSMALSDGGYRVVLAANGRRALELLSNGPLPDLIITDFMMPVLDGVGFIQAMQQNETHRGIPLIIMSSIPEDAVRSRIHGYAEFIRKPFRLATVTQLVTNVLARSSSSTCY
jgi:CheY-like chemotaxis protein